MNKRKILVLKQCYKANQLSLGEVFEIARQDAYVVRPQTPTHPPVQCRIRAGAIAFPLTVMWLNLEKLLSKISPEMSDRGHDSSEKS
ncbi:hypothetical protein NDA01_21690 [Trichocoleus desertorum AS-A10]|uniref:hypothetical protein n=1 Tax=Trichocoleus desertorum TaxID=1481672 RepID=UPI0032970726